MDHRCISGYLWLEDFDVPLPRDRHSPTRETISVPLNIFYGFPCSRNKQIHPFSSDTAPRLSLPPANPGPLSWSVCSSYSPFRSNSSSCLQKHVCWPQTKSASVSARAEPLLFIQYTLPNCHNTHLGVIIRFTHQHGLIFRGVDKECCLPFQ